MSHNSPLFEYSPTEEKLNIYTHGLGFVASLVALALLIYKATVRSSEYMLSVLIYGTSMCILYFASTVYHNSKKPSQRARLKIFDHCAIYLLIAGTYTPFTLVTLPDEIGHMLFAIVWGFALSGVLLKLFFTGKFDILSTFLYVAMGWLIVFAYKPLLQNLPEQGVFWLFAGGVSYTVGAILYSIKKIPFNHAIFHLFVLLGSFFHFWTIYKYI